MNLWQAPGRSLAALPRIGTLISTKKRDLHLVWSDTRTCAPSEYESTPTTRLLICTLTAAPKLKKKKKASQRYLGVGFLFEEVATNEVENPRRVQKAPPHFASPSKDSQVDH